MTSTSTDVNGLCDHRLYEAQTNMADDRQLNTDPIKPWTRRDEENLLLEISEDERLVRLGIDPDEHPLLVLLKLKEKQRALQKARLEKQVPAPDKSEK